MRNSIYIRDHLIKPLLFINFELQREMALMKDEIKAKDREIQAYINKGQRIMKGIATPTFVDEDWTTKQLVSAECLVQIYLSANCVLLISTSVRHSRTSRRFFTATGPRSEGNGVVQLSLCIICRDNAHSVAALRALRATRVATCTGRTGAR